MEQTTPRSFVHSYLPWIIAAAALLLYLVTLSKAVTPANVGSLASVNGLEWRATLIAPLNYLITYPVRWMPAGAQLFLLNLLAAVFGALTLALLARSVAILPHDRTHEQRIRQGEDQATLRLRTRWVPPLLAVLLLAFHRSFWENAILDTGEMLDVLMIAYVIRCFLEHRLDERDRWLFKAALVYGLGIANNYAFIAFFPAFIIALIWLKRLRFFEFAFLTRMFLLGIAGLLLYLVLPLIQSQSAWVDISFWQALKTNLGHQKQMLTQFPRWAAFWLGGFPLVLLLIISIRWKSGFGDISAIGNITGQIVAHIAHLVLMGVAIYLFFDPRGSARDPKVGFGLTFLSAHYMMALAIGYFAGYLLLIFSDFKRPRAHRRQLPFHQPLSYLITAAICAATLVLPVLLIGKNHGYVALLNSRAYEVRARQVMDSLPQSSIVLSDDRSLLLAVATLLGKEGRERHLLLETIALKDPSYHRFLRHRYGDRVPAVTNADTRKIDDGNVLEFVRALKRNDDLIYLNPSFGYFFEVYYGVPEKHVYRLKEYAAEQLEAPVPDAETINRQNEMWNALSSSVLQPLQTVTARFRLEDKRAPNAVLHAGVNYSRALNHWGVELQRAGQFDDAAGYFTMALALNPDNPAALINKEVNESWRKTGRSVDRLSEEIMKKLEPFRGSFDAVMVGNGPIDEPSFAIELAQVFVRNSLLRQAAQQARRALVLAPETPSFQLILANILLGLPQPERAMAVIESLKAKAGSLPPDLQIELARTEAATLFSRGEFATAEKLLQRTLQSFPDLEGAYIALEQFYVSRSAALRQAGNTAEASGVLTNALRIADQQIQRQPENPAAHFNRGLLCMNVSDYESAAAAFTRVLTLDSKNTAALMNRAIANFQARKFNEARNDYEKLLNFTRTSPAIYYGLAEIAYEQKNWQAARENYQKYLKHAPANPEEVNYVRTRLAEVKKKS